VAAGAYYATVGNIKADADDDTRGPDARIGRVVRMASNIVKGVAAPPAEDADDRPVFMQAAKDATIALFWYLWDTRGYKQSQRSVTAADVHWYGDPQILKLIGPALGPDYYVDPNDRDSGKALLGTVPPKVTPRAVSAYAPDDPL